MLLKSNVNFSEAPAYNLTPPLEDSVTRSAHMLRSLYAQSYTYKSEIPSTNRIRGWFLPAYNKIFQ